MTEHSFKEVVYQWGRMCEHHFCNSRDVKNQSLSMCPIILEHNGYPCDDAIMDLSEEAIAQVEEIVMKWAEENPEPVYPTWGEWLHSQKVVGVHAMQAPSQNVYYPIEGKLNTSIPADIAEKLGLQPKERET